MTSLARSEVRAPRTLLASAFLIALGLLAVLPSPSEALVLPVNCQRVDRDEAAFAEVPPDLVQRLAEKSRCMLVRVPLDYSGRTPGTVDLFVRRVPTSAPSRGAVVALAGGPGQSTSSVALEFAAALAPILADRELVLIDQRGTGRSGALACPTLEGETLGPLGPAVQACAAAIGPRRAHYTTADSADDIEIVRRELGLARISIFGVSYGTRVGLAYAQSYPSTIERLLLDSVVPLDGSVPYMRDVFTAVPRVLRELCANGACRAATTDPVGDLAALVKRLAAAPLRGHVVGADGKRRARRLGRLKLLRILISGDQDPSLRAEFPAGVRAALRGDEAPLLRVARRAAPAGGIGTESRTAFSPGLFVATACEEGPLPWQLADPFSHRWGRTIGQAGTIPEAHFFPFDRATGRASDMLRLCAHWPANGSARRPPEGKLPDVPALLLSGAEDLRTPSEEVRRVGPLLPRSTSLTVPRTGHSVLINDLSGCASRAVRAFFAGQPVAPTCPRRRRPSFGELLLEVFFAPTPLPPASLAQVPRKRNVPGLAGRTLTAVDLTIADGFRQLLFSFGELLSGRFRGIGGLRGGTFGPGGLDRYSYVPGVEISSIMRTRDRRSLRKDPLDFALELRLRVTGRAAARGTVVFDLETGKIRARLGGRRYRAKLDFAEPLPEQALPSLRVARRCCRFVR